MSKVYELKFVQRLPVSMDKAWDFFSNPANLQAITPAKMGFSIISKHHGDKMYAGQIIEYNVKPVLGIPLYWMTEITHVADRKYFIDEQRFGPFKFWHHQHHFKAIDGGVEMTDILTYGLPFGILGEIAHGIMVKSKVKDIFAFREQKVNELFGVYKEA